MIITALDFPTSKEAIAFADQIDPTLSRVKVGKELFTASGPDIVAQLQKRGFDVFLDLKFHDIPNTVAGAIRVAVDLGVWMVNVHASGGPAMLEAAREACPKYTSSSGTRVIAVTVLTSMDKQSLSQVGVQHDLDEQVKLLTQLTHEYELDGVVCSPLEAGRVQAWTDDDFLSVTPGVRPAAAQADDQRRVMTPLDAKQAGSNYLVIGRPITQAQDPIAVLKSIKNELNEEVDA